MKNDWKSFQLSNGIRCLYIPTNSAVSHLSFMVGAGSRDENPEEHGTAHFIEHMLFKGTQKRKAYHVLSRLDDVGGDLNAYTTKEETCIHASFLSRHLTRAAELISDIAFNSTFPEKEIEKEKEVVMDEIASYQDSPTESIFEEFESLIYPDHALGRPILGTKNTVRKFKQKELKAFLERNYSADRTVVALAGKFTQHRAFSILDKFFGQVELPSSTQRSSSFKDHLPTAVTEEKKIHQTHAIIGSRAYPAVNPKSMIFALANNVLGGPAMNNRLNLNIREKHGFTYNLESFYHPFSDTGLFGIYLGTDSKFLERSIELVHKELDKMIETPLGPMQLHKAKSQFLGQLALGMENKLSLALNLSKAALWNEPMLGFEEIQTEIEAIKPEDIQSVCAEVFPESSRSCLIYKAV